MNYYQRRYPGSTDDYVDAEYTEAISVPLSTGGYLLPRRADIIVGKVMDEARILSVHDYCTALLAKSGMENVAALSFMEQQFNSMAPQGAERYREIVDAYAQKVAGKIRRW